MCAVRVDVGGQGSQGWSSIVCISTIKSSLELKAHISDVFKVDGGDSVSVPRIYHVASHTPLLGVSIELQDLVTDSTINISLSP